MKSPAKIYAVIAAVLGSAGAVSAQQPANRGQVGGTTPMVLQPALFADSLANMRDTVVLRVMERENVPGNDKAPPELHLRYALIEKRVFEVTDDDDARKRAQHSFDKAKDQDAQNTWAHFGYGWALTRGPEFKASFSRLMPGAATISTLGGVFGLDAAARAKRSLQRALDIDPAFEPAVTELARLALLTKLPKDVAAAASASRKAIGAGRATPSIYTQLAELEMLRGNGGAAAEAARAGMSLKPDGTAQRALGIALLAVPSELDTGGDAYMRGINAAAFGDTALLGSYMRDAAPLFVDADRTVLANLGQNEKAQWLAGFWERSAAKAGRTIPQRLAEHFRRMQYALAHYQRGGKFGIRGGGAFIIDGDNQKLPFDDRGLIYVRLGTPHAVISTPPGDLTPPPNETWVYTRDGVNELYNFHKFTGSSEYVLSALEECDPIFLKFGQQEADRHRDLKLFNGALSTPNGGIGAVSRYMTYLQERAKYDPRIMPYAQKCEAAVNDIALLMNPNTSVQMADAIKNRVLGPDAQFPYTMGSISDLRMEALVFAKEDLRRANTALKTDDARPRYETQLEAITQLYAFRGKDDATAVTAAVLIPGQRFTPQQTNAGVVYPLSMSLIMIDSVTGRVQRVDSKPSFRADQSVSKGKWFRATIDMESSPMTQATYRVVVENKGNPAEGDIRSGSQKIPSYAGPELMMSDLVVGEGGDGRWKRGKVDINPIPSHQVEKGKNFKLFYEVYNMPASAKYRTTITVNPKQGGGIGGAIRSLVGKKAGVELNFDDVAEKSVEVYGLQQMRSIGADMDAGQYDLTVTITNIETQAKVSRTTKLVILGPKDLKAE